MKPYKPASHITFMGLLFLGIGSILLGLVLGGLAYFISNLIYFFVLFPLGIGIIAMFAYTRLVNLSKIRQSVISSIYGIVLGVSVAVAFYGIPYLTFRNKIIAGYQEKYQIDALSASIGFDQTLKDVTGSSGILGYMKLRATSGEVYTQYLVINSLPIQQFSLSLKDTGSWVNWTVETLLFIIPSALMGYLLGKRPFSSRANEWYDGPLTQIGSVRIEDSEKLDTCLHTGDIAGLCELILPEGIIKHPQIEVSKQTTRARKSDILLTINQTRRVSETRVKRMVLSRWEVQKPVMESFLSTMNAKFTSTIPGSAIS